MATYGEIGRLVTQSLTKPISLTASKPISQERLQNFLLSSDVLCVIWPKMWDFLRVVGEESEKHKLWTICKKNYRKFLAFFFTILNMFFGSFCPCVHWKLLPALTRACRVSTQPACWKRSPEKVKQTFLLPAIEGKWETEPTATRSHRTTSRQLHHLLRESRSLVFTPSSHPFCSGTQLQCFQGWWQNIINLILI